ncbi:DUF4118 domain-containing protein [Streptomyces sp. NPDC059943]|uniref:DUF4118 domain-containing protein n=1 Tax=Streptomyces sp. NPDC059943 TaxID=3347010 RepID=UPI00364E3A20
MRLPLRDVAALAAGFLAPFATALIFQPFRTSVTHTNLALVFMVVVVAVSALGNRLAGAIAALSAAAWFDFFHTAPFQTFDIDRRSDIETAVLLFVAGLIVSQLAARARVLKRVALTDASHLERLHGTTRLAQSSGASSDEVVRRTRRELTEILDLSACRFEYGTLLGHPPRLDPDGTVRVADWIWDLERQGWPEGEIELRADVHGRYQGRFMITPTPGSVPPSLEARLVAADLVAQAATALDDDTRTGTGQA